MFQKISQLRICFLLAAHKMVVAPVKCFVFENTTVAGMAAANNAGMQSVLVSNGR